MDLVYQNQLTTLHYAKCYYDLLKEQHENQKKIAKAKVENLNKKLDDFFDQVKGSLGEKEIKFVQKAWKRIDQHYRNKHQTNEELASPSDSAKNVQPNAQPVS